MANPDDKDDSHGGNWPWNDQTFRNMQAEHQRFMNQLKEEGRRLQQHLESELTPSSSPFASFKRFIDDNFNTLTEGFRNFPANLAEVRARMQQEQERRREEEADISRRWTGSSDSPDHIRMELERSSPEDREAARDASLLLIRESWKRNQHVPPEKIVALFADPQSRFGDLDRFASPMLSWGGACYYKPETGDNLPSTQSWAWTCGPAPRWLSVDWFKRSPYSPVRLEAHPEAGLQGTEWRAAFEDLLNASLDKPMDSREEIGQREPHGQVQSTLQGPGLDWMLSLQCRGILPPQLPRLYSSLRGGRENPKNSITNFLSHGAGGAPWSSDSSFGFHSAIERDFSDLMAAVGTKATPEAEFAMPITSQAQPEPATPETELDLYESVSRPTVTRRRLVQDLMFAVEEEDEKAIANVFSRWMVWNPDLCMLLAPIIIDELERTLPQHNQQALSYLPMIARALRNPYPNASENEYNEAITELVEYIVEFQDDVYSDEGRKEILDRLHQIIRGDFGQHDARIADHELEDRNQGMLLQVAKQPQVANERAQKPAKQTTSPLKRPDVLSALTTTHTIRSPDGTVTTKVVLKQRFADGREETHESVHTEHEPSAREPEEKPKKKGWFWS